MVALNQTRNPPTSVADSALEHRKTPPDNNSFPTNRLRSLLRARYYDPHSAEFLSPDPLEYVDGMSLFRGYFVGVGVDPTGLARIKQKDRVNSIDNVYLIDYSFEYEIFCKEGEPFFRGIFDLKHNIVGRPDDLGYLYGGFSHKIEATTENWFEDIDCVCELDRNIQAKGKRQNININLVIWVEYFLGPSLGIGKKFTAPWPWYTFEKDILYERTFKVSVECCPPGYF